MALGVMDDGKGMIQVKEVNTGYNSLCLNPVAGNVGIGDPNPSEKLTVAGTIESTSGGVKFPDGTTQTTAAGTGNQMLFFGNTNTVMPGVAYIGPNGPHSIQETAVQFALPRAGTARTLKVNVKTNTYTSGTIFVIVRKNGANTAGYAAISTGQTGVISGVGASVSFNEGDLISLQIDASSAIGGDHELNASMLY